MFKIGEKKEERSKKEDKNKEKKVSTNNWETKKKK